MDATNDTTGGQMFTCPMHPELRRNGPGRCPVCGMNLEPVKATGSGLSPLTIGLCLFLGVAAYFLWTEHRAHLMGALPYLLVLVCPIIHLFMHRGRHGQASHPRPGDRS